jgi:hypothetical protein
LAKSEKFLPVETVEQVAAQQSEKLAAAVVLLVHLGQVKTAATHLV